MSEFSTSAEQLGFGGKCWLGFYLNMEFSSVTTGLRKSTRRHLLFLPGFVAKLNITEVDLVCSWSSLELYWPYFAHLFRSDYCHEKSPGISDRIKYQFRCTTQKPC